jgi:hypothetical protein
MEMSTVSLPHIAEEGKTSRGQLTGHVLSNREVGPVLRNRLFELFGRYYLHCDRESFDRDQAEKDWVLLLSDGAGVVQGFTTLKLYDLELRGRPLRAVFSGNTIIDPTYWGEQELVWSWCSFMAQLKSEAPRLPLYWFLICSGYRTYLYLPLFYHEFFPRHDRPTPQLEQELIDTLGRMKFPDEYQDGVVHVRQPRECLLPDLAAPAAHKQKSPHVRFFTERNPGWRRGDELVCITEFSLENTKRLANTAARNVLLETARLP